LIGSGLSEGFRCQRLKKKVSGVGFQVSAPLLAAETASLIEEETLKKQISNNEYRMSKECILSF
jgi:hypothetical protein